MLANDGNDWRQERYVKIKCDVWSKERMSEDKRDGLRQERCLDTRMMPRYRAIIREKSTPR